VKLYDNGSHFVTKQELQESEALSFHAEELNCLSRLVAGIAHEINSPLGALQANSDTMQVAAARVAAWLAQNPAAIPDEIQRSLRALEDASAQLSLATERVNKIIERLGEFAQLDRPDLQPTQISKCLETTLRLMRPELGDSVEVIRDFSDVPEIEASPRQLNRLFMNLLLNAHEAVLQAGRSGRIRLRVFQDRDLLGVEIEDNGCGISPEMLSKIFDPGFTTKGVQVGTGLGLSSCYQIVQAHQGRISVHSREGIGTRFAVLLPVNRKGLPSAGSAVTR
jgi:two-component system, NtrC family, sensor kinase